MMYQTAIQITRNDVRGLNAGGILSQSGLTYSPELGDPREDK